MNDVLPLFLLVWGGVGAVLFSVGMGILQSGNKKKRNCTHMTTGVVAAIEVRTVRSSGAHGCASREYFPVFQYTAEGRTILAQSPYGSSPAPFQEGEPVTVFYNPANAEEYYVKEAKTGALLGRILTGCGIACILLILAVSAAVFL